MDVFTAAKEGDFERLRALAEQDLDVIHATGYNGWTPLLCAALNGRVEVAQYLLDHGATVNHHDLDQRTALHWACLHGHAGLVLSLLQTGADVTAADDWGRTPLMAAATAAIACMLLEHGGSDVDAADYDGWTACHWACRRGHSGVLRQLLKAGADPAVLDTDGRTPLDHAAAKGHQECTAVLQERDRAYTLHRTRSVREGSLVFANSNAPVDAALTYLVHRATSGLTMPTVHVSPHMRHEQPSDHAGEERHVHVESVSVGGVVTVYAIEELKGEMLVELMELMGITGCGVHEL